MDLLLLLLLLPAGWKLEEAAAREAAWIARDGRMAGREGGGLSGSDERSSTSASILGMGVCGSTTNGSRSEGGRRASPFLFEPHTSIQHAALPDPRPDDGQTGQTMATGPASTRGGLCTHHGLVRPFSLILSLLSCSLPELTCSLSGGMGWADSIRATST